MIAPHCSIVWLKCEGRPVACRAARGSIPPARVLVQRSDHVLQRVSGGILVTMLAGDLDPDFARCAASIRPILVRMDVEKRGFCRGSALARRGVRQPSARPNPTCAIPCASHRVQTSRMAADQDKTFISLCVNDTKAGSRVDSWYLRNRSSAARIWLSVASPGPSLSTRRVGALNMRAARIPVKRVRRARSSCRHLREANRSRADRVKGMKTG